MKGRENSDSHRCSILAFNRRCARTTHVDKQLEAQRNDKKTYWTEVLRRVVAAIIFLSERGLAFRISAENLGSKQNGNFLGVLKLITQFDPFLKEHLKKYGSQGRGRQSYLSSTIYEELILLMKEQVEKFIVSELKSAKYFSISVDSTIDRAHIDQLTVIVRYVIAGKPTERFLTFLQIGSHKAENLVAIFLKFFGEAGIDFQNCRGQSYTITLPICQVVI